ncbi:7704_t:CDS:2 [Cetraspora pellucida]|uniref:7704_t:CDS:1 n=1 Tax=Cetraspora pellucida TaxID=1433469 RepID=A0A9N9D807_9GLOM|nr:7704_t:CDS:2 [Cetraspora pellucida]
MELILNDISYSETINMKDLNIFESIIKKALPSNYKYFIESFEQISSHSFLDAYETPFKASCRINILTIEESEAWLQKFMDMHKITMRETHGRTIKEIHYILSKWFHCIHSHIVKLKQGIKNNGETNMKNTQEQNTNCPATLSIQLLKRSDPYPCIVSLHFDHNHPLKSSHVMSFRPLSNETKNKIIKLFETGHNPSSAYHTYWEQLQLNCENDEEVLADRSTAPRKSDIFYLYKKHCKQHVGAQNGKEMFDRLVKEVSEFNDNHKEKAWLQSYIAPEKEDPGQPLILVILTNLMICCYELQEAGELVYMDTTAGLDILNTPLIILSTSTPVGGLPLAVILTSDESTNTFTKALDILNHMILSIAFGKHGSIVGPQLHTPSVKM